jgi:large subunit ribosomal protein L9e
MKVVRSDAVIRVPRDVKVTIKSRVVEVTGKYGTLRREFKHVPCDLKLIDFGRKIRCEMWFGTTVPRSCIRTVVSHIENMFTGVQKKYVHKLKFAYQHFPINSNIINNGKTIEIRNFLGEKVVRSLEMLDGCTVRKSEDQKDEIIIEGTDLELVSRSAALIHQSTLVRHKDIRKFLDGIYVSYTGLVDDN